jgi:hypothetical protein
LISLVEQLDLQCGQRNEFFIVLSFFSNIYRINPQLINKAKSAVLILQSAIIARVESGERNFREIKMALKDTLS